MACCKPTLQQRCKTAGIVDVVSFWYTYLLKTYILKNVYRICKILAIISIVTGSFDINRLLKDLDKTDITDEKKRAGNTF